MRLPLSLLVAVLISFSLNLQVVVTQSGEARLMDRLLETREMTEKRAVFLARPVNKSSDPLSVSFSVTLSQIVTLDEEKQALTIHIWEQMSWKDDYLTWDPDEYDGVELIQLPVSKLWIPDIIPYKVLEVYDTTTHDGYARGAVGFDGTVQYVPQRMYAISCDMDITLFPFDKHKCSIQYGSWTYDVLKINATLLGGGYNKDSFIESQKWKLLNVTATPSIFLFECIGCSETLEYQVFTYDFHIERQTGYFTFVLLLPAILLYLITLVTFCLPPDHSDKIQIGLSIFLSYFVLLLILVDSAPQIGTSIPVIGQWFCLSLVLIALSVFCAALVFNIDHNGLTNRKFPDNLKRLVDVGRRLLWLTARKQTGSLNGRIRGSFRDSRASVDRFGSQLIEASQGNSADNDKMVRRYQKHAACSSADTAEQLANQSESPLDINNVLINVQTDDQYWFLLACLLDRVFLIIYIIVKLFSITILMPWFK